MRDPLDQGRQSYARRAWTAAYQSLTQADQVTPLGAEDLERLAISAYLINRDDDCLNAFERAHLAFSKASQQARAARSAFWLGMCLLLQGETARATGWLARARRQIQGRECVEQGYLLLPVAEQQLAEGKDEVAHATATSAATVGERFSDPDLTACARHLQGRAFIQRGMVRAGLSLLDEAMVAVVAGELSPMVTGLIYCSVIRTYQQVYAWNRAREWTSSLARWCEQQPELVAFTDACLVHRAEIMQLHGAWPEAVAETRRACQRSSRGASPSTPVAALYQQAELHRLTGDFGAAESAYRQVSQGGWEPQPGLALLWLAQGRTGRGYPPRHECCDGGAGACRVAARLHRDPGGRGGSGGRAAGLPRAGADRAAVRLRNAGRISAAGPRDGGTSRRRRARSPRLAAACVADRQEAKVPYLAARARVLMGVACCALSDDDGGRLELDAARVSFKQLGAVPDIARVDSLMSRTPSAAPHGLTPREMQVLRLVAAGKTNKAIASELSVSEKTIDRHVSNIFAKLDVPSRAAATAYAYKHKLI